jgi:hypothetical protein
VSGLDLQAVRRYSRQIALPEVGSEGQARILAARIALVGHGLAIEVAARYLAAAGVCSFRSIARESRLSDLVGIVIEVNPAARAEACPWPFDENAWLSALEAQTVVVRLGFDDDAMVRAAVHGAVPVVAVRIDAMSIDVLSLRRHGPCPHLSLDVPMGPSRATESDPGIAVVAGALAACETLDIVVSRDRGPRARHLRLVLGAGEEPLAQDVPWAPECFACGGSANEAVIPLRKNLRD